jgi:hypothetical protein
VNYLPISSSNPYYVHQTMTVKTFFTENLIQDICFNKYPKFNDESIIRDSIFIFNQMPIPLIHYCFSLNKFLLQSGNITERGNLNTRQLKLSQFITCAEGMKNNTVFASLNKYDKLAKNVFFF